MIGRDYEQKQLKNKWDILKKDWQLWTNLLRNETGLGWDPVKQTITGSDEWWERKLKEIPEAIKFRFKGLRNADQLEILFKDVAATGEGSWAPSMGFVPNDGEGGPSNDYIGDDNNMYFQEENVNIELNNFDGLENIETDIDNGTPIASTHDNGRKRKLPIRKRDGAAVRFSKQLDRLCQAVESRPSIAIRNGENGCSIVEVMEVLHNMEFSENDNDSEHNYIDESDAEYKLLQMVQTGVALMAQERFQHSGETISRWFGIVLDAVCHMAIDFLKPSDPQFKEIPKKIRNDDRYWPYFKDCIGAIDGTHIPVIVPTSKQIPYIGRKGIPTQNVMAACDFNMCFTFAWAGWEGTAHDTRIFLEALRRENLHFPHPPTGKYYLVDAGYPHMTGYLGPYKGERYHLPDFRRGSQPRGKKEIFNHAHSSLRCTIERTFGVWKNRWKILRQMPSFPFSKQVKIVIASMVLHNFIRRYADNDQEFQPFDNDDELLPTSESENQREENNEEQSTSSFNVRDMDQEREQIATLLMFR
ncbi:DDE Tnp4 domain-containing protein [Citrus sinensis]|nr:DDE Tnp4 domain-containing protein [Citrus sinensis]